MARTKDFPKVKGLYKKRTANGIRYVLHGSKKEGGKTVDYFVTVPHHRQGFSGDILRESASGA